MLGFHIRHALRSVKGNIDANHNACICLENLQLFVLAETDVRAAPLTSDVSTLVACSVVAAIKRDGSCVYIAYVDEIHVGTNDAFGLASNFGMSMAVFHTCLDDLMLHIRNLEKSLDAQWYPISSISVKAGQVDPDMESCYSVFRQ